MYHAKPGVTKLILTAVAALCTAGALQWPQYAPGLTALAGFLGGGAFMTAPGTEKRGARTSMPPQG